MNHPDPLFARDYEAFKLELATLQAEQDAFDDEFGLPKTDLAYIKALERCQRRIDIARRIPWARQVQAFRGSLDLQAYAAAIGVGHA